MPPPPLSLLTKEKRSITFAPSPPKPRTLPRSLPQPTVNTPFLPPSSTQAFLEKNVDDFFPSPSQEIRELLDDIDDLPTNTQIARELEPESDEDLLLNAPSRDNFADFICTQDLVLSSQDMLEITTPRPLPSRSQRNEKSISTPTPIPSKSRQPRRRFFEEKDEDLLHAAILESKMLAANQRQLKEETISYDRMNQSGDFALPKASKHHEGERPAKTTTFSRTLSNVTDYGEDEFHDCEDELLALC